MREIITLSVGQCGNQVANQFWKTITREHNIDTSDGTIAPDTDPTLIEKTDVFFTEAPGGRYVPRSVLVDLEPGVLNAVSSNKDTGRLFNPDSYISAQDGAGNNWAKGYMTEGAELIEDVLDKVRHAAENCDAMQSFQLMHSIGGGTGSGLGSLILEKLTEEYPTQLAINYSVFPGSTNGGNSDVVVEPYNSILTLNSLIEYSSSVFSLENNALNRICQNNLKINNPSFEDINYLVAQGISNTTASLRFPGYANNCDYRKLTTNLVPFPRLHFLIQGQAPLLSKGNHVFEQLQVTDVCQQMFDSRSLFNVGDPFMHGKILTASCLLRGKDISTYESEQVLKKMLSKHQNSFVEWIPDNMMNSICKIPACNMASNVSGTFLANSSVQNTGLLSLCESFEAMFRKNAYVHWFTNEGLQKEDFTEAISNVRDLIAEYQQYENAQIDEEGDDEEMEDLEKAIENDFKPNSSLSTNATSMQGSL